MRSYYLPSGLSARLSACLSALLIQPLFAIAQVDMPPMSGPAVENASATAQAPLTLPAAIALALQHNPDLKLAARDVEITEAGINQAGVRPNPELSWLSEGLQNDNHTTTIALNQALELGGKRPARIAAAERERDVANADLALRRSDLRALVVTAFFEALTAQERLQLAEASQGLAQSVTSAAARRVLAGKVSPLEETRAKIAQAGASIELRQAGSAVTLARQRLGATWGSRAPQWGCLVVPAQALVADVSLPQLLSRLPTAPQMLRSRLEIARQQSQVDVELSRRIPDLTVSIGSKRDQREGRTQAIIGLSLPLPLFNRNQGNVQSALRKTDKARDELAAVEQRLASELTQAWLRHQATRAELEILQSTVLPGAQSAFDAASQGFALGKFNFLDVLDAQRTLFQSKSHYLNALAESHRASVDIERLVGVNPLAPSSEQEAL
jgi:cobalt-zinc-cadmium efflux system outer membrane protein